MFDWRYAGMAAGEMACRNAGRGTSNGRQGVRSLAILWGHDMNVLFGTVDCGVGLRLSYQHCDQSRTGSPLTPAYTDPQSCIRGRKGRDADGRSHPHASHVRGGLWGVQNVTRHKEEEHQSRHDPCASNAIRRPRDKERHGLAIVPAPDAQTPRRQTRSVCAECNECSRHPFPACVAACPIFLCTPRPTPPHWGLALLSDQSRHEEKSHGYTWVCSRRCHLHCDATKHMAYYITTKRRTAYKPAQTTPLPKVIKTVTYKRKDPTPRV